MIKIANPAYDVVFKYLMENNKIAAMLLSDLLQEELVELEFRPIEQALEQEKVQIIRFMLNNGVSIEQIK